jgi:hypothetical protein
VVGWFGPPAPRPQTAATTRMPPAPDCTRYALVVPASATATATPAAWNGCQRRDLRASGSAATARTTPAQRPHQRLRYASVEANAENWDGWWR